MSDKNGLRGDYDGSLSQEDKFDLTIQVPQDIYRAYQRCCWIINYETGRDRDECAKEMVIDFLVKHGC